VADIHVERTHALGLAPARQLAQRWAERAEEKLGVSCTYEEPADSGLVLFERPGIEGRMRVDATSVVVDVELGFLFSAFQGRIEGDIAEKLDALLARASTAGATP
jgi:putative polyhydroxyalkanoate system protein